MAALTTAIPSQNQYQALFQQQTIRRLGLIKRRIDRAEPLPSTEQVRSALHVLDLALNHADAWPDTAALLISLAPKMEQAGYRDEWIPYLEQGIQHAEQFADAQSKAELHFHVGVLYQLRSKYDDARSHLEASAQGFEVLAMNQRQARALNKLAVVARFKGQLKDAKSLVEEALSLVDDNNDIQAYSFLILGLILYSEQDWQESIRYSQLSLTLWEQTKNYRMIAWCHNNIGIALRAMDKPQDAIDEFHKALELYENIYDPINQSIAKMSLGNAYISLGQPDKALGLYQQAKRVFQKSYSLLHLMRSKHNINLALRLTEKWDQAEEGYLSNMEDWKKLGDVWSLINSMEGLGLVYLGKKRPSDAKRVFSDALKHLNTIQNDPRYERMFKILTANLSRCP